MSIERIKELMMQMNTLQAEIAERKDRQTRLQKELDRLRNKEIPDLMAGEDVDRLAIKSIGTLHLFPMAIVKQVGPRDSIREYLEENGWGDIVVPSVNSSTLKALVLEQMEKGHEFPDELFDINMWSQARILKG